MQDRLSGNEASVITWSLSLSLDEARPSRGAPDCHHPEGGPKGTGIPPLTEEATQRRQR